MTYKLYVENFNTIHKDPSFFYGTSICPPVSQMIEWLDDINTCYSNKYENFLSALISTDALHFSFLFTNFKIDQYKACVGGF